MRETRIRNKRRKSTKITPAFLMLVIAAIFTGVVLMATVTRASDEGVPKRYKYYTTLYIEKDMTLWDIANEYSGMEYNDPNEYIKEVVAINHIKDPDHIEYGTVINIPYYSEEYK